MSISCGQLDLGVLSGRPQLTPTVALGDPWDYPVCSLSRNIPTASIDDYEDPVHPTENLRCVFARLLGFPRCVRSGSRAHRGGAQAAEFLQLLNGDRFVELGQSLAHTLQGRGWRIGLDDGR